MAKQLKEELTDIDLWLQEKEWVNKEIEKPKQRWFIILLIVCVSIILLTYLLVGVFFEIEVVKGNSMQPTLSNGDWALSNRLSKNYIRGDIAVISVPGESDYVKRVVGIPGDSIDIDKETGSLVVNGQRVIENYTVGKTYSLTDYGVYPIKLGENEYFVLGDNRQDSIDSRLMGTIDISRLRGKLIWY